MTAGFGLPWQGAEVAAEAEAAGVSAFCTGDFIDHEAYTTLASMAAGTSRARVGTAIAYAFSRTPFAHASAVRSLLPTAEGRLFIGLGTGAFKVNRDWFGVPADRPLARMGELLTVLRAYLDVENGEKVEFAGEFYQISAEIGAPVLGKVDVPLLVGAFNEGMARLSGRRADGLIGHGLFTTRWWDDVVRPAVATGAEQAGRAARPLEYGWVITAVNDADPARARRDARRMIAFYLTVATYDRLVDLHGWTDQVDRIRKTYRARDFDAMADAVTDDMVEAIAVCGTAEEAGQMLRSRSGGMPADLAFLAPPSFLVSERRRHAYARAAIGLLPRG